MGEFDIPGIKVETKALYEFAKNLSTGVPQDLKGAQDAFQKLPMKVGGSGLPSAVVMANWSNSVLFSLSVHMQKLGLGTGALGEASMAIGTIYQNSDVSASDEMNAVNSTFNPKPGDKTFSDRVTEQQQQAEDRAADQQQAITAQATQTSLGPASTAPGSANSSTQSSVDPETNQCLAGNDSSSAQQLVQDHIDEYGGDESKGYYAPNDTPEQYRSEDSPHHVPNMRPVPVTPTYYSTPYGAYQTPSYPMNVAPTSPAQPSATPQATSRPSPTPQSSPEPTSTSTPSAPTSLPTTSSTSTTTTPQSNAEPSPSPSPSPSGG